MAQMILSPASRNNMTCSFGCCGPLASKSSSQATKRTKKALKTRDRQSARKHIQEFS